MLAWKTRCGDLGRSNVPTWGPKSGFRIRPPAFFRSCDPCRRPQDAQKAGKEHPEGFQRPKKRAPNADEHKNLILEPILDQSWGQFWAKSGSSFDP